MAGFRADIGAYFWAARKQTILQGTKVARTLSIFLLLIHFRNPSRASGLSLDSSAPSYENLNMDHIAQLVSEGFPQGQVIRALAITR